LSGPTPYRGVIPARRECVGSERAAAHQARDTIPGCHASIRRMQLRIRSALTRIRSQCRSARRQVVLLRWFQDSWIELPQVCKATMLSRCVRL